MNFADIYRNSEEKVRRMLLTFWTPGYHPMRRYVDELLHTEPLMAEPVFQSIFPWETDNSNAWSSYLSENVIDALEIGKRFNPRTNQSESWKAAHDGDSIVVTSGTGSGKTECFMFPVLDTISQHREEGGIQAIFLYPLNALMEDQRNRLDSYCKKLHLTYAVYNGSTPEMRNDGITEDEASGTSAEIRNRNDIREFCPHILLTNPSMLEYILVRNKDQNMLMSSQGKLRWMVIDEAHTFSGSSALEMRWLLKRTLDAFGVTVDDVRFACTSATIGDKKSEMRLRSFISTLTGQKEERISIIGGRRVVPDLNEAEVSRELAKADIDNVDAHRLLEIRHKINSVDGMSLTEIIHGLIGRIPISKLDALDTLDKLCKIKISDKPILSLRAHFHMRTINGLFACGNPDCPDKNHPRFGHITSHFTPKCSCGANMLELGQCFRCKTFVLIGKEDPHTHTLSTFSGYRGETDYFALSEDGFEEDVLFEDNPHNSGLLYLAPTDLSYVSPTSERTELKFELGFRAGGPVVSNYHSENSPQWTSIVDDGKCYCSECAEKLSSKRGALYRFRISVNLLNSILSPVFLNECSPDGCNWGKYLAFTDSRQGTAKSAKGFNIEVERNITRKQAYEALRERYINPKEDEATKKAIEILNNTPLSQEIKKVAIEDVLKKAKKENRLTLKELADVIFNQALYNHISDIQSDGEIYRKALLRQFLKGRALRGQNAESLGLMTVEYEGLTDIGVPSELDGKCSKEEWHDFLKIILDYLFRSSSHVQPLEQGEGDFFRDTFYPTPICSPVVPKEKLTHWPVAKPDTLRQSKFVRLLCIALGIHTVDHLNANIKVIDNILVTAFNDLKKAKLIKEVKPDRAGYNVYGDDEYVGTYYLDLSQDVTNIKAGICKIAWICPVSQTFVDRIFKGYSPTMGSGEISIQALSRYRITDVSDTYDNTELSRLILGPLWSNFHDNVTDTHASVYIAAEHSGQQDRELLQEYTADFKSDPPMLNVLQCSTTMEMGVDIGDIDFVLLTTIPPAAANYMQRVGRAGRSNQTQAAAFSFCNDTPTGMAAFNNPMWAIKTFNSIAEVVGSSTILQRHVNAFFFREYLLRDNGMSLATTIGEFVEENLDSFITWLDEKVTDTGMQQKFRKVFGANVTYSAERSVELIRKVKEEYQAIHIELDRAVALNRNDDRRRLAIMVQISKLEDENLLVYLSNAQFLPNANMPTGVMDFKLNDEGHRRKYQGLINEKTRIKNQLRSTNNPARREQLKENLNQVRRNLQRLDSSEIISREGRLALNEYAPAQTVVVNERNYPSAGILMRGEYGTDSRERFLYICRNCGTIEYLNVMDEHRVCPNCGKGFNGILDDRAQRLTLVYEPVGFSADVNGSVDRKEISLKRFYDIRPVLLGYGQMQEGVFLTEISPSHEYGSEILFCNAGGGYGFSICTRCGRAEIEERLSGPLPDRLRRHKRLDSVSYCDASINNIKRNVVLTARHQTCYVVIAFMNPDGHGYVNDEETALSLGVILKRAVATVLGIDGSEVDFGVREEKGRWLVFIYDTAKGGCGYSLYLKDSNIFQKVLDEALRILRDDCVCKCEKTDGACPDCLSSRDTFMYDSKLSKRKALDWLTAQSMSQTPVPTEILTESPNAKYSLVPLYRALENAVCSQETTGLTFVMSDYPSAPSFADALDASSPFGRIVLMARHRNIPLRLLIEFHSELYSDKLDLKPFENLENLIPGGEVRLVKDFGQVKPLAMVETATVGQRFMTLSLDALEISGEWGSQEYPVFVDDKDIAYETVDLPEINDCLSEMILAGVSPSQGSVSTSYFRSVISPAIGFDDSHEAAIREAFEGKSVKVDISDPYLISPLAVIMAVDLTAELCDMFGCHPVKIMISNTGRASRFGTLSPNDYCQVSKNFSNQNESDDFTDQICNERLGIQPEFVDEITAHFRFLRMEASDGSVLEIRPDHGFAGGWKSGLKLKDISEGRGISFVRSYQQSNDILYYLLFKRQ